MNATESNGQMLTKPAPAVFDDVHDYESTKGHDLVHWSGSTSRLARTINKRFGDDAYAFEELVA